MHKQPSKGGPRIKAAIFETRTEPEAGDLEPLREMLESTGVFHPHETSVAMELLEDRILKGQRSEYLFIIAGRVGSPQGYICYGPIAMAPGRFDIYWMAVRKDVQGKGIGSLLLEKAEKDMARRGGSMVFVETSSRKDYMRTREFYGHRGYALAASVQHFYGENDNKEIFLKSLGSPHNQRSRKPRRALNEPGPTSSRALS